MNQGDVPREILSTIESVVSNQPTDIEGLFKWLLTSFSEKSDLDFPKSDHPDKSEEDEIEQDNDSEAEFYDDHLEDDDYGLDITGLTSGIDLTSLKRSDFHWDSEDFELHADEPTQRFHGHCRIQLSPWSHSYRP